MTTRQHDNKLIMKKIVLALLLASSPICYSAVPQPVSHLNEKRLTLDFVESPVRLVLQALSEHLPKGLVLTDSVQGNVSISMRDVLATDALDMVLKSKGLQKVDKNGNYLILAPTDNSYFELLQTETIKLKYAKVSDIKSFLSENPKVLSEGGSVLYDSRTNTVVVNEIESMIGRLVSVINSLDVKLHQVEIEAKIIEVSTDYSKDLGVKLSAYFSSDNFSSSSNFNGSIKDVANAGISLLAGNFNFNLFFDALEKDGLVTVVSTPKILTVDNTKARVSTGTEIPYQTSTITNSGTTTNTSFKSALLSLDVTPSISPDGDVYMSLQVTKDSPSGYAENGEVIISTNSLSTSVVVGDGNTVVLGGVYSDTNSSTNMNVPVISKIPYIGNAFKNKASSKSKKELLIFLTPRVIK